MNSAEYQDFLNELAATLEADPRVTGLVAIGSTADPAKRDEWSDHDFWIITETGAQTSYLDNYDWLPWAEGILITVKHGKSYRSALYKNRHKIEYAVFDREETGSGWIERFQVLLDRGGIGELAESIRLKTHADRDAVLSRPDLFENFCVLLWSTYEKGERGERLSEQTYIQHCVNSLLNNLIANGALDQPQLADKLDPRRRLEQFSPELAKKLDRITTLPAPEFCAAMIELAEQELSGRAPDLAWDKISVIKEWLKAGGKASSKDLNADRADQAD